MSIFSELAPDYYDLLSPSFQTSSPPSSGACQWFYSGSASDGLGDPDIETPTSGMSSTGSEPASVPPAGWHEYDSSSGSITLTRNLSASAAVTQTTIGMCSVYCFLGGYSIGVHAHPYAFRVRTEDIDPTRQGPYVDRGYGHMLMPYAYLSTSGQLSDLSPISIYETLFVSGSGAVVGDQFVPVSPPFFGDSWTVPVYSEVPSNFPTTGKIDDIHDRGQLVCPLDGDGKQVYAIQTLQNWRFKCPVCGENELIPSLDGSSGPVFIERVVALSPDSPVSCDPIVRIWRYSVYKLGYECWIDWAYDPTTGISYPIADSKYGLLPPVILGN